jgi:hypothetical protein
MMMMEEGKAIFIKLGPKKKGKGNMVEKGIVILNKFFCTRMDTKSLKRQLKFA